MKGHRRHSRLAGVLVVCLVVAARGAAQSGRDGGNYVIGPHDILNITVWNQKSVSGQYTVERDGTFTFPLIGRVKTSGLTLREFEMELTQRLADGFFRNPQVTVSVVQYRSKRIFVVGEVRQPGTYPLTGDMSLIEALASAGSTTLTSADEVLIVRASNASGPILPGENEFAEVIKVDLRTLQSGERSQNVALRDSDTVFVPRASTVYVFGHVRSPGAYPISKNTTVLQALSLAGGVTEFGATNRIKIVRVIDGKEREIKVKLNHQVQPGDTIIVPERFF